MITSPQGRNPHSRFVLPCPDSSTKCCLLWTSVDPRSTWSLEPADVLVIPVSSPDKAEVRQGAFLSSQCRSWLFTVSSLSPGNSASDAQLTLWDSDLGDTFQYVPWLLELNSKPKTINFPEVPHAESSNVNITL